MSLIDLVRQQIGQSDIANISQELGADPASTEQAIDNALPMMIGGMAHMAQQPGGEGAIQGAMSAANSAEGLGGLGGMLGGGGLGGILGSILGQHNNTVQDGVQKSSGFDSGKAGKLLILLAPFVLRALAKHRQSAPQDDGGLAGGLQQEAQNAQVNAPPHVGGVLGQILGRLGA